MVLQSIESLDNLRVGEIVSVRLQPYFSTRRTIPKQMAYWATNGDNQYAGRFTTDHFVGQNLDEGSIYENQVLEYALRRIHTSVENGIVECAQFSLKRFDPISEGYSERRALIEKAGLWIPERKVLVSPKHVRTLAEGLYPKEFSGNFQIPPKGLVFARQD